MKYIKLFLNCFVKPIFHFKKLQNSSDFDIDKSVTLKRIVIRINKLNNFHKVNESDLVNFNNSLTPK